MREIKPTVLTLLHSCCYYYRYMS